ncbi:YciI family protein [Gorillibacterium sp. sgz5001074]|uniref:YciI family protein n=1 Tax=Gorillibacterium sp. sgz5001074 TaxID=3446695 RepID=UPI003F6795FE
MEHTKQEYAYIFKPKRERFLETLTPEEMAVMGGHAAYSGQLFAEGTLVMAGACAGGDYGIIVFRAGTQEEAEHIFRQDPAVQAGIVHAELFPFRIMIMEGRA